MPLPAALRDAEAPAAPTRQIVALDANDIFRRTLIEELMQHGFAVEAYADRSSFLFALNRREGSDLILLDWDPKQGAALALLRGIRRLGVTAPVVFLTSRTAVSNEAQALDAGAADFIDKARGFPVLVRRLGNVRVLTSRTPQAETNLIIGVVTIKLQANRAFWNSRDLNLTLTEFKLVRLLAGNAGCCITYRQLYDCITCPGFIAGSGELGFRDNVRSAIKRLRRKLRIYDDAFDPVENCPAAGYVWNIGGRSRSLRPRGHEAKCLFRSDA